MLPLDSIEQIFTQHQGIMRTKDLLEARIYYKDVQWLLKQGLIEKIRYGYYRWAGNGNFSDALTVTRLFPDAILCMNTALFYYRYSDRVPHSWHLAVSKDSSKSRFNIVNLKIQPYFIEPAILGLGVATGEMDGVSVRIYDKERTICDCLRYMGKMDQETFNKAIRGYIGDNGRNIPRLMDYAARLRVSRKVKTIIGVWM